MRSFLRNLCVVAAMALLSASLEAQTMYEISDAEKVGMSTLIFEGQVVGQQSFKTERGMIFTDNAVRVFKLFRGNIFTDTLHLLTQGGQVGNELVEASDLLELRMNDYGLFFANVNVLGIKAPWSQTPLLDVYSSAQGFYRMDWLQGSTSTPFKQFSLANNQFYDYLRNKLKLPAPAELHMLDEYLNPEKYLVKVDTVLTPLDSIFPLQAPQPLIERPASDSINPLPRSQAIAISSFSPNRVNAGATADVANNLLTIVGTDFGSPGGNAAVLFDDANDGNGGTDWTVLSTNQLVVSWTNTQIQVRTPSRAGTGLLKVRNQAGSVATAGTPLQVFYSILAPTTQQGVTRQANLVNRNGAGGYNILYSSNLPATILATTQRAVKTWKEVAGFNLTETGATNVDSVSGADNLNVVMLDNANTRNPPLAAGVLAVCYSTFTACNENVFSKTGFDIVVRNQGFSSGSTSFEAGPCPPATNAVDLETVLLHELGHAANLGHINDGQQVGSNGGQPNPAKLMHFAITLGQKRISPDLSALQGALSQIANTTQTASPGTCSNINGFMTPLARTLEAKDDCPLSFPTDPTFPGTTVAFNLEHATSNVAVDPQFDNFKCSTGVAAGITNTAFYAVRTNAGGQLDVEVTEFVNRTPGQSNCTPAPGVEMAIYQVNTCPAGQNFPPPVACRTFSGNGPLASFTGLTGSTTYLMVMDGISNAKANFKLTFTGSALPLKLRFFVGQINGPVNTLQWSLEAFSEVARIVLERSTENNQYVALTSFDNSQLATNRTYVFDDASPANGLNYYRLAIFNKDGSVEYSQVVLLNRFEGVRIVVRPNPVRGQAQLNVFASSNVGNVSLQLMTMDGKRIYQQTITLVQGQSNYPIALQMPAGTYFVTLVNNKGQIIASQTLLKQ